MNIEQEIQAVKDELEIRNLAGRFSDAANRRDFAAFGKLWTTDGKWQVLDPFPFHAEGAANIQSKIGEMIGQFELFVQMTHEGVVELNGETATGRWTVQEMVKSKDGKIFQNNVAMYDDKLEKQNGKWLFASRIYHYIYFDESELKGKAFALPEDFGRKSQD